MQVPRVSYHNVDSYVENEGFFFCATMTRLDYKKQSWIDDSNLQKLSDDLVTLVSELVDLENLEIYLAILEHLEEKIEKAGPDDLCYQMKIEGISETTIEKFIMQMNQNLVECLGAKDYRQVNKSTALKVQDLIAWFKASKRFQCVKIDGIQDALNKWRN